ncbi:MAG: 5'/3'-nucleotidase SurE [Acidimicrobiia bacterium]|nr:5'/3'-nucleotidase SurE [Acidimicrobiia bacterium]
MPVILVTNDDGVTSEGIHALADAMRPLGEVLVVAPLQEASAIGHALTLRRPLRIEPLRDGVYGVDGTPTDCVNLACAILLKNRLPDLVVSGINKGWNLGDDITYSGTVSGALEGALLGSPGIAVSLKRSRKNYDFGPSADAAATVAAAVLEQGLPPRSFININVPGGTPKGVRITTQAKRNHVTKISSRTDPRGTPYYWIEEALDEYHPDSGRSDYEAVRAGYVSVTPLQPDMTAYDALERLAAILE